MEGRCSKVSQVVEACVKVSLTGGKVSQAPPRHLLSQPGPCAMPGLWFQVVPVVEMRL